MSRRGRTGRGFDIHQMQIEWKAGETATAVVSPPADAKHPAATMPPEAAAVPLSPVDRPVLRLQWDFRTSFPQPTPEAIDAGSIAAEDAEPESIRSIHAEHGRQLLEALRDLDAMLDARRRGVDPPTGRSPASHAGRERLREAIESGIPRIERWYANLLAGYQDLFGNDAADAFDKTVRAWHAGVEVIADTPVVTSPKAPVELTPTEPVKTANAPAPKVQRKSSGHRGDRIIARLPVPRPLAEAVSAGHFGVDENGKPINPSADEVHAITRDHAEELTELLADLAEARRRGMDAAGCSSRAELVEAAVQKYAEDFGDRPARQLLAYCRRQTPLNDQPTSGRKR